MIRIENLTKRFGRTLAVDGLSLEVAAGQSVALWGANGAGKSTVLRCILGLYRYTGRITVGGHDARRHGKRARRLIGYVPQELGFNDDLRVGQAVALFARLKGVGAQPVDGVLARVGLAGQAGKRMRELSGGMKQRLALGLALLGDPPVLILDEVTASLDTCGREEFVTLLAGLAGSGRSLLFASHRPDEIATLARTVAVLDKGRLAGQEPGAEFAARQGASSVLHVHLPAAARVRAGDLLRAHGFEPSPNGVGLFVPVTAPDKDAPLRVLRTGGIPIEDFDLVPRSALHTPHAPEVKP
jgi:ABC-type multidrug transport system ATPase subunit